MEPSLALLTESRSICLWLRTTSLAMMRADFTSPFLASCLTVPCAFFVAVSSWKGMRGETGQCEGMPNLPHLAFNCPLF